jgi:polysaccharide export outer membrane protein
MLVLTACHSPRIGRSTGGNPAPPSSAQFDQTVATSDVLRFQFVGAAELNQSQKVRADGRITLPMIGEVAVAGKRPAAVQAELMALYKPKLQNNELYVSVESSTVPIYVSGAVNRQGRIVLERQLTVLEAVMEAGGFTRGLADTGRVQIIRRVGGKHQTIVVNLTKAMRGETTDVVYVQPYDVVVVPEKWL